MRGATTSRHSMFTTTSNFNPRSSCEERPPVRSSSTLSTYFNPRSSCEERHGIMQAAKPLLQEFQSTLLMRGATFPLENAVSTSIFQSTLLMRGATGRSYSRFSFTVISIHAPHARSDTAGQTRSSRLRNFNPRSSCEERPQLIMTLSRTFYFNPRSSCEERPACPHPPGPSHGYFNPRSSCEERHSHKGHQDGLAEFQSTLLMRGATFP